MYGVKTKLEIAKDIYNAKLLVLVDAEMYLAFLKKILLRDPNVAPTVSTLEKKLLTTKSSARSSWIEYSKCKMRMTAKAAGQNQALKPLTKNYARSKTRKRVCNQPESHGGQDLSRRP
jgi:hypothetical protein